MVGDIAKIGVGLATSNPALIFDGVTDITPNVCDFLEDTLELDEGDDPWKQAARFFLDNARDNAEKAAKASGLLDGGGAGGAGGGQLLLQALKA